MAVKISISEAFQNATGGLDVLDVTGENIGECLREAAREHPALQKIWFDKEDNLAHYLILFLNGENVPKNNLSQAVKEGDEIFPVLMIGGG